VRVAVKDAVVATVQIREWMPVEVHTALKASVARCASMCVDSTYSLPLPGQTLSDICQENDVETGWTQALEMIAIGAITSPCTNFERAVALIIPITNNLNVSLRTGKRPT
jgi:hypothetical protein